MPTTRENLVLLFRSEIARMKEQGVPALMREKNVSKLKEALFDADYTFFEDEREPKFSMEELGLKDADDVLCAIAYIWKCPFMRRGDEDFVENPDQLGNLMASVCGEYGEDLAYALCKQGYYLMVYKTGQYCGLTLEQLLNPRSVRYEPN